MLNHCAVFMGQLRLDISKSIYKKKTAYCSKVSSWNIVTVSGWNILVNICFSFNYMYEYWCDTSIYSLL